MFILKTAVFFDMLIMNDFKSNSKYLDLNGIYVWPLHYDTEDKGIEQNICNSKHVLIGHNHPQTSLNFYYVRKEYF